MNIKTVKRPDKRMKVTYLSSLNLQGYGDDNLYPQRMFDLINNSPTGGTCMERYRAFLEGNGLYSEELAAYVCNDAGDTVDGLFRNIAHDAAYYGGFALHVTYNQACRATSLTHIPFELTRLEEEDDAGRVAYIAYHPDWEGLKTRRGKTLTIAKQNVRKFYPFNPRENVIQTQILKDGGIEMYRGQVLWVTLQGSGLKYPRPIYDKVVTELSIDEGLSNVKYRNVRNNFHVTGMLIHKKGYSTAVNEDGVEEFVEDEEFGESLEEFQGDTNACSLLDIAINQEEDAPKFVSLEGANFDKKFEVTESSTVERIYAAFNQEPWYCVRRGKTGFSGSILAEAYEYYNSVVDSDRRTLSRALARAFSNWFENLPRPEGFMIEPLLYQYNYKNGTLDETQKQNGEDGFNNNTGDN